MHFEYPVTKRCLLAGGHLILSPNRKISDALTRGSAVDIATESNIALMEVRSVWQLSIPDSIKANEMRMIRARDMPTSAMSRFPWNAIIVATKSAK